MCDCSSLREQHTEDATWVAAGKVVCGPDCYGARSLEVHQEDETIPGDTQLPLLPPSAANIGVETTDGLFDPFVGWDRGPQREVA